MALWERARRLTVSMSNAFEREWTHGGPQEREAEAAAKMALRDAIRPYEELCEAATDFLGGGEFYLPGTERAVQRLNRMRLAAQMYQGARHRDKDEEQR